MHRHIQSGPAAQIPLALNLADPEYKSVLHAAYRRLELSRRLSFEQVMSNRVYAIGVRNLADAIVRRWAPEKPAKRALAACQMEQAMRRLSPGAKIKDPGAREGDH